MPWRVLITARVFNTLGQAALELLRSHGCKVIMPPRFGPLKLPDLLAQLPGIDATLCSPDQYNLEVLQSPVAQSLKVISRWGVGYDSIDIPEATRQGIVVAFTPGMLNETVADWTWALLLSIARRVPQGHLAVARGEWTNYWGHDVHGKTLGIIGCGRIGQAVARRATGFNMRVLGFDIQQCDDPGKIEYGSLERLLADSDFVSLHAALTPQNRGLLSEPEFRRMKPTSYLINTARGPLIDEIALARALHEGWIAGAALDVFALEPLPADSPLRNAPNLVLTPHQASFARETAERVCLAAAQAIIDSLAGRKAQTVVAPEVYQSPRLRLNLKS